MAHLSEVRLTGTNVKDAIVQFKPGPNVITGDSDTGKSYLLRLVDYVLGADELTKVIDEALDYETAWVEFRDGENVLTLERHLSGGTVRAYSKSIADATVEARRQTGGDEGDGDPAAEGASEVLLASRKGRTKHRDVTSRIFPFFGMDEDVRLRKNDDGDTQRLSIRTLLPTFLISEDAIIAEGSPILASGYQKTPAKRMFSYLLTGKDDAGIVARERTEMAVAEINAKMGVIDELLASVTERLQGQDEVGEEDSAERLSATISELSNNLAINAKERAELRDERAKWNQQRVRADTQLLAIDGMLTRYRLLDDRYSSDLQRLDFMSEGAHYYEGLQDTSCPLCGHTLSGEPHGHEDSVSGKLDVAVVRQSTLAEASKIRGLQRDLGAAISDLEARQAAARAGHSEAVAKLLEIDARFDAVLAPGRNRTVATLDELVRRRLDLQSHQADREEEDRLQEMRRTLEAQLPASQSKQTWASLEPTALTRFCREVENVLKAWSWSDDVRVEFEEDRDRYDIKVNGKPRRAHGKGLRAVLHAAFSVALLRYCRSNGTPHPGFIVLDSPLTTVKQRKGVPAQRVAEKDQIDARIEPCFWEALAILEPSLQVIVLDNKEPREGLNDALNLQLFAGEDAVPPERVGFIPPKAEQN